MFFFVDLTTVMWLLTNDTMTKKRWADAPIYLVSVADFCLLFYKLGLTLPWCYLDKYGMLSGGDCWPSMLSVQPFDWTPDLPTNACSWSPIDKLSWNDCVSSVIGLQRTLVRSLNLRKLQSCMLLTATEFPIWSPTLASRLWICWILRCSTYLCYSEWPYLRPEKVNSPDNLLIVLATSTPLVPRLPTRLQGR